LLWTPLVDAPDGHLILHKSSENRNDLKHGQPICCLLRIRAAPNRSQKGPGKVGRQVSRSSLSAEHLQSVSNGQDREAQRLQLLLMCRFIVCRLSYVSARQCVLRTMWLTLNSQPPSLESLLPVVLARPFTSSP
jgi:hypothetical protein